MTFPAPEDDADPFEGQDAYSAVVGFALLALRLVKDFGPFGARDRLTGEFVKSLAEKLWAEQSTVYTAGFSTAFNHGGNSAGFLDLAGLRPTSAICAESTQQPGC